MYHINSCAYCHTECDMYGHIRNECTHPDRIDICSEIKKFFIWLFNIKSLPCEAVPYYEHYCPLYEYLITRKSIPPKKSGVIQE